MTDLRDSLRENLRKIRKQNDLNQSELSEQAGFSRTYAGQIERGEKEPSLESLIQFARVLDVSVADFFPDGKNELEKPNAQFYPSVDRDPELGTNGHQFPDRKIKNTVKLKALYNQTGEILNVNWVLLTYLRTSLDQLKGKKVWKIEALEDNPHFRKWLRNSLDEIPDTLKIMRKHVTHETERFGREEFEVTLSPIVSNKTEQKCILGEAFRTQDVQKKVKS